MILGIGTDIVRIDRFKAWESYSYDQLRRVFTPHELLQRDAARLASRFAAKEAFYKALSASLVQLGYTEQEFSLLFICQHVEVRKGVWDVPALQVAWKEVSRKIQKELPNIQAELSLSHEREFALAYVILQS
jgi:phosphopantethiene--protein transferase domain